MEESFEEARKGKNKENKNKREIMNVQKDIIQGGMATLKEFMMKKYHEQ